MKPKLSETKETILSRILIDPISGCWNWTADKNPKGYGRIWISTNGRIKCWRSHRLAFQLWNGPIPEGIFVLHKCDNPSCCNPEHLFLGDNIDNIKDSIAKGRWINKLEKPDILSIKKDSRSVRAIALDYGVHCSAISRVKNGKQGMSLLFA